MLKPVLYLFLQDCQCTLMEYRENQNRNHQSVLQKGRFPMHPNGVQENQNRKRHSILQKGQQSSSTSTETFGLAFVFERPWFDVNLITKQKKKKKADWIVCHDVKTSPLSVHSGLPMKPLMEYIKNQNRKRQRFLQKGLKLMKTNVPMNPLVSYSSAFFVMVAENDNCPAN
ncbi:hypothetical protein CEXT_509921 [Caerostris extrusa]|uniref:Uncharacterized protein n=1 Tax=Caerostris extrusa TaxID=172846 RepID=A0AAV4MY72_CAEEX|nr:hypothetical protein CEXT_509921 [Caerostris extrusa]